jgi:predicted RNase H-like HicB family nuclease
MADYRVILHRSEEGRPGCWSQGATEDEAIENIRAAIEDYIAAAEELARDQESRIVRIAVA